MSLRVSRRFYSSKPFRRYNLQFIKNAFLHRLDSIHQPNLYKIKYQLLIPLTIETNYLIYGTMNSLDYRLHLITIPYMLYSLYNLYKLPVKLNYKLQVIIESIAFTLITAAILITYYMMKYGINEIYIDK